MDRQSAPVDYLVAVIATRQHGVVSIGQLRRTGLSDTGVRGRLRAGWLHRVHRGVYAVGHTALTFEGRSMAAVLAFGDGVHGDRVVAAVSHRSAAALWGLLKPQRGPVDVSISSRSGRSKREGIRLHRCASLTPELVTCHRGIPVTTPAHTIADLRRTVPPEVLRRAIRQAQMLNLTIGPGIDRDRTRSELEHLFLRLCRRHRLPMPDVNARIGALTVDFLWREQRLIVETDGYRYHRGRAAFEDDHDRDLALQALDFEVIRLSYRQVMKKPKRIAAILRKKL
jgi:very-short-patch-repair endonuclease